MLELLPGSNYIHILVDLPILVAAPILVDQLILVALSILVDQLILVAPPILVLPPIQCLDHVSGDQPMRAVACGAKSGGGDGGRWS